MKNSLAVLLTYKGHSYKLEMEFEDKSVTSKMLIEATELLATNLAIEQEDNGNFPKSDLIRNSDLEGTT